MKTAIPVSDAGYRVSSPSTNISMPLTQSALAGADQAMVL
ncbi:hypothetical protein D3OALGB2SA_3936 [Olavius algarvensis associated proteobacterium Delta 3]|nr:hypothetical protein D3OALGB2SA_3936 [Olavius algarvensis associated proteobacterium Delta 3]